MIATLNIKQVIQNRLGQKQQRRVYRQAFIRAYTIFAQRYPEWAASLFDEHFLSRHIRPSTDRSGQITGLSTPIALAHAWIEQCPYFKPAKKEELVADLTPVASDFIRLLAAELCSQENAANLSKPVIAGV